LAWWIIAPGCVIRGDGGYKTRDAAAFKGVVAAWRRLTDAGIEQIGKVVA